MSFSNVIVANIGWSSDYMGGNVSSGMRYVTEHGTGAEAYNFQPSRDGLFYGYIRGGHNLGRHSDHLWTVVYVSKPNPSAKLRVVGWYEDAQIGGYTNRYEYRYDPDFPVIGSDRIAFNAVAAKAYIVAEPDREQLILPSGHRIKSGGLYYAAGTKDPKDNAEQRDARETMAAWLRRVLPRLRVASRLDRPAKTDVISLPGVILDEDGTAYGYSPVAETDQHRALRIWAQANPEPFTGKPGEEGKTEWTLLSADRVDAAHELEGVLWVIEVKSRISRPDDLERGVFQCIKYRAVAQAMCPQFEVRAVLLTERDLPVKLVRLADEFGIRHIKHWCESEEEA